MPAGADEHDLPDLDAGTDADGNPITATHPLRYRPAHYVPFKVPLYDEQYTQVQQDLYDQAQENNPDDNIKEPEPLYRWYYRPELQFSQYDFDAKSLIVKQTDDQGNETTSSIDISEDGTDFGPLFDEYTDSVELLFDLLGPDLERLPALETEREFVLSLGGEEVLATIGQDGKVVFENPEHLNQLSEEDLLSLRLYLNGDSANVLWEYQIAGFGPFWSIYPGQQPEAIRKLDMPAGDSPAVVTASDGDSYYILGGMRIKIIFQAEQTREQGKPLSVQWSVSGPGGALGNNIGYFYASDNPTDNALGRAYTTASVLNADKPLFETYYQPDLWRTDLDVTISAQVTYSDLSRKTYEVNLKSRELYPVSESRPNIYNSEDPQAPLKGSDVAMLEGLLWQLGISPQKGSPGSEGARINSDRGNNRGWTHFCDGGEARERNVFSTGWDICSSSQVSLEAMVKRFNARNLDSGTAVTSEEVAATRGTINQQTLEFLERDMNAYLAAHEATNQLTPFEQSSTGMENWITEATQIWQEGSGERVPATLTDNLYNSILRIAGLNGGAESRANLLTAWLSHESRYHWGGNDGDYQVTPYRMNEGGADENGSLSFSQLLYQYRYGPNPCAAHGEANLNLYHPGDNLKTMVIHTAADNISSSSTQTCEGGLHRAFVRNTLATTYNQTNPGEIMEELRGYRHAGGAITRITDLATSTEDDYEKLAKAIGIYNSNGTAERPIFTNRSWVGRLRYMEYDSNSKENSITVCHSCKYSIEVRNEAETFAGHLREYVWEGGSTGGDQDVDGNGRIEDIPASDTSPEIQETNLPNVPWCFVYGEPDWIYGTTYDEQKDGAKRVDEDGNVQAPENRITCDTGIAI